MQRTIFSFQAKSSIIANQIMNTTNQTKQCRICLENDQHPSTSQLIKPCNCSGSVEFIHEKCLKQWITTSLSQKSKSQINKIINDGIQCQLCKFNMKFEVIEKTRCRSCQKLQQFVRSKSLFIFFILALFILSTAGIILTSWTISHSINFGQINLSFIFYFSLCGFILSFSFFVIAVQVLIFEVFLQKYTQIGNISQNKEKQNRAKLDKSRKKILPTFQQSLNPSLQMISYVQ